LITYRSFSISGMSCSGVFWGPYRPTTFPSLSTKNFVKFLFVSFALLRKDEDSPLDTTRFCGVVL
jgi:hypothetical protein